METTTRKTITICSIITLFIMGLYIIFLSRIIMLYLLLALILVIAINPLVVKIEKKKIKKVPAVIIADLFIIVLILSILGTIIFPLVHQIISLVNNWPNIMQNILNNETIVHLSQKYHFENDLTQLSSQIKAFLLGGSSSILAITSSILSQITALVVVLVLTFLLQIEGSVIWQAILGFFSGKGSKERAEGIAVKITKAVSGFVSGNLFISLIAGVVTFITMMILTVPYSFALAALVAVFDLIPLVGASLATIIIGLVALTQGVFVAIIAVIVILIYQFIEGHFIQPIVYSKSINLSALIIVIASVLGAEIGGIIGILLAIPMAAIVQIAVQEIYNSFHSSKNLLEN